MKQYHYIFVIFASLVLPTYQRNKQYRKDYEYNAATDAFYKFHTIKVIKLQAKEICHAEGAQLLSGNLTLDIDQAREMFKLYPDMTFAWIEDVKPMVIDREGIIITNSYYFSSFPFICKVEAIDAFYDSQCDVYGKGYEYFSNTSSCYKPSNIAYTWNQAYEDCEAEGGNLVVINSETENNIIYDLLQTAPHVPSAKFDFFYFIGVRATGPRDSTPKVFQTIFNQTLQEVGFAHWGKSEPNNVGNNEDCVCFEMGPNAFNDIDCMAKLGYVCEKSIIPFSS